MTRALTWLRQEGHRFEASLVIHKHKSVLEDNTSSFSPVSTHLQTSVVQCVKWAQKAYPERQPGTPDHNPVRHCSLATMTAHCSLSRVTVSLCPGLKGLLEGEAQNWDCQSQQDELAASHLSVGVHQPVLFVLAGRELGKRQACPKSDPGAAGSEQQHKPALNTCGFGCPLSGE